MTRRTPTAAEIRALGVITDLVTAGECFGLGRRQSYELAQRGEFPVAPLRIGRRYRVRTADVLAALGHPVAAPDAPARASSAAGG